MSLSVHSIPTRTDADIRFEFLVDKSLHLQPNRQDIIRVMHVGTHIIPSRQRRCHFVLLLHLSAMIEDPAKPYDAHPCVTFPQTKRQTKEKPGPICLNGLLPEPSLAHPSLLACSSISKPVPSRRQQQSLPSRPSSHSEQQLASPCPP
jgi:hypothetical protein